jgi:predicted transposase YbfD/YdcC
MTTGRGPARGQDGALGHKKVVEKDHGRLETREYFQSAELGWFADQPKWEGLQSIGMVQASREINGKISSERRYYLSSLPLDIERFARAVRGHWGVENKLHWVLDVNFRRIRTGPLCTALPSICSNQKRPKSAEFEENKTTQAGTMPISSNY